MFNRLQTKLAMFLIRRCFIEERRKNPTHKLLFIRGTEKDYPDYLVFTDDEETRNELYSFCE